MDISLLINCYGIICLCMIVFNVGYAIYSGHKERVRNEKNWKVIHKIREEAELVKNNVNIRREHKNYLLKTLKKDKNLLSFDQAMDEIKKEDENLWQEYVLALQPMFFILIKNYKTKEDIKRAYFAHVLWKYTDFGSDFSHPIYKELKELIRGGSVFTIVNVMKTIYSYGCVDAVVSFFQYINKDKLFIHNKIITEGLLGFDGDYRELANKLWRVFPRLNQEMQIGIMNFIRLSKLSYGKEFLEILTDARIDRELHFSAIRYFSTHKYLPACQVIRDLCESSSDKNWEYKALCATALATYPGDDTIKILKLCLKNRNWYVRSNAADSIIRLGVKYEDIADVMNGSDRYAREILEYTMNHKR